MGYSCQLATRDLLYTLFHRQDSTYHSLCYTTVIFHALLICFDATCLSYKTLKARWDFQSGRKQLTQFLFSCPISKWRDFLDLEHDLGSMMTCTNPAWLIIYSLCHQAGIGMSAHCGYWQVNNDSEMLTIHGYTIYVT